MSKIVKKYQKSITQSKIKLSTQKIIELQNVRIMQKNLVYVIGLSAKISSSEVMIIITLDSITERILWTIWQNH